MMNITTKGLNHMFSNNKILIIKGINLCLFFRSKISSPSVRNYNNTEQRESIGQISLYMVIIFLKHA